MCGDGIYYQNFKDVAWKRFHVVGCSTGPTDVVYDDGLYLFTASFCRLGSWC
jgi:hypothetical protein